MNNQIETIYIKNDVKMYGLIIFLSILGYIYYSYFMSWNYDHNNQVYKPGIPSYIKEIIIFPILLLATINIFGVKVDGWPLLIYLSVIIFYSIIGILMNAPDKFAVRYYLVPIGVFIILSHHCKKNILRYIYYGLYLYFISILLVGYFQSIYLYQLISQSNHLGNALEILKINRLFIFFGLPTIAGPVLGSLLIIIYHISETNTRKCLILSMGLPVFIMIFSRGAIISLSLAMLVYVFMRCSNFIKIILICTISGFIYFIFEYSINDAAFSYRLKTWLSLYYSGYLHGLGNGIGFVTASGLAEITKVHDNDYLRYIYEVGFVGLISFLFWLTTFYLRTKNYELLSLIVYMLINMLTSEFHMIYPATVILYIGFVLILHKGSIFRRPVGLSMDYKSLPAVAHPRT
jgi:hypothetical protein